MVYRNSLCVALLSVSFLTGIVSAATIQNFQGGAGSTPYTLRQYENAPGAAVTDGSLLMVNTYGQRNVIAFNRSDSGLYGRIAAEWDMSIVPGADGLGFALLDTSVYGTSGAGPSIDEEPSLASAFAVGFDVYCPDDYQRKGSHEISLHFDGVERANKWSPFDYRTGSFNRIRVVVDFVTGGAEITISVAGQVIYDRYFLAGMTPFDARAAFGARTGGLKTTLRIDNVNIAWENPVQSPQPPVSVRTFDRELMNGAQRDVSRMFSFPSDNADYERIVLKLTVEQPPNGWDGWDRMMAIYVWDQSQQNRFEIARFMTPYSRAGTWYIDVTDYQILLRGDRKMGMWVDSWEYGEQKGYWITTDFDFYRGRPRYRVLSIQNLWSGTPVYGSLNDPTMSNFFRDKSVSVPAGIAKAKLRFMVTGHGQSPNSESGAEFIARSRTATVNGSTWTNLLWRDDCYLNPCRPQGGTWQGSRAGWAPGDRVWPWDIDVTSVLVPGQQAVIDYVAEEYYNYTPKIDNNARHWVESQIIYYQWAANDSVAHWPMNDNAGASVTDVAGSGFDGLLMNMENAAWTQGKHCAGLSFDGVDDYVTIPDFRGVTGRQSRTCSAWVRTTEASVDLVGWGIPLTGRKWRIRVSETGSLRVEVQGGYIYGSTAINDGQWHHVAVVLENDGSPNVSEVVLYVDGVRDAIAEVVPCAIDTAATKDVSIGYYARHLRGQLDEIRVYGRVLGDSEILSIYETDALTADIVADGRVSLADFAELAALWNAASAGAADLTCDGTVDTDDLAILIEEWLRAI